MLPHVAAELVGPGELPAAALPRADVGLLPGVGPHVGLHVGGLVVHLPAPSLRAVVDHRGPLHGATTSLLRRHSLSAPAVHAQVQTQVPARHTTLPVPVHVAARLLLYTVRVVVPILTHVPVVVGVESVQVRDVGRASFCTSGTRGRS